MKDLKAVDDGKYVAHINESMMNFDHNSLQLFDSSSQAEDTSRIEGSETDKRSSAGSSQKGRGQMSVKGRIRLNLDEIENISDCDLDSIKNNSARAVTFNQFELTKNIMNPKQDTSTEHSQIQDLDQTAKIQENINASSFELVNHSTEHGMASASSTKRRIDHQHTRKSLGDLDEK